MSSRMSWSLAVAFCLTATAAIAADLPKSDTAAKKKQPAPRISSSVDAQPRVVLSDEEAKEVSFAAGRVLKHVVQARDAIREGNTDEASAHVKQGLKLIAIIDNVLPSYSVKTVIKSGEFAYSDEEDVAPRYVTLFDELERRDVLSPIVQAKRETQRAQQKDQAAEGDAKAAPETLAISHADILYSTAKLDLVIARQMLAQAGLRLNEGRIDEAEKALLAVQSGAVLLEYEEIDLPLEEAADNLKLAEIEMQEGRHADAKAALDVAVDQLKRYEALVGENRGAEVKSLHEEISKLTEELASGEISQGAQQQHSVRISDWWRRAAKWLRGKTK